MKIGFDEADKYGNSSSGSYFSLKDDGDTARVRFLYNDINDVEGYAVHEVKVGENRKRYVNCLRAYGAPIDDCPFCKSGKPVLVKYFVPIYNLDTQQIQTWDRGKKFGQKLSYLCSKFPSLVSKVFEITRNGKAGDQQTTYEIMPIDGDSATMADFQDLMGALGTPVLDKTPEEMEYFNDREVFPGDDDDGQRREYTRRGNSDRYDDMPRRTPSSRDRY